MKTYIALLVIAAATLTSCMAHSPGAGNAGETQKDSIARAAAMADSLKMEKLLAIAEYPYIKGSKFSGVIPVSNPTEIPDPKRVYKLLFELAGKNPDSLAKDINSSLDEVARILNLHVASGIPPKNIIPVIVIHGPGIEAVMNNESYKKKHSMDNPNIKIIHDMENVGTKFIVCGQAMAFFDAVREDLLPGIKISLTAQTVLSNYQSQGFVLYVIQR